MTEIWKSPDGRMELRLGRWQDVLVDINPSTTITDPPYSDKTHSAYRVLPKSGRRAIDYQPWSEKEIVEFVGFWSAQTSGWIVTLTDNLLINAWTDTLRAAGRYVFAPLACVEPGSRVRIQGDGPANWTVYAIVSRPRNVEYVHWGSLVGAYVVPMGKTRRGAHEGKGVIGGKPIWLMRQLIRDYSRRGDLVCDPCSGGATTLLAAAMEGRKAIGAECDPETYRKAVKRLSAGYTPQLCVDW